MAKATKGNKAQFTYDFGISIAQSTINKVARLAGVSLTLASAFYSLRTSADSYIKILRKNTLAFGGMLSTMKAMEQAQERLIKGQSYFNVDDQLQGMRQLQAVGIDVGKNLDWINKAAHATGKNFAEFSNMIASAIQGNAGALVEAGLMTQRATRMFDKYAANTIMRQQAILNFVKNHKGLMNAIKNDFETIQDQSLRMKATWQAFLKSIVGKPNDPQSFYGQITASMKMVAVSLSSNADKMRKYGYMIGQTVGWLIKQIGYFVVWVGRQTKKVIESVWKVTENYQEQTRSIIVWMEFWKLKVLDFFKEYGGAIKTVLKLLIAYKALKFVFVIGKAAIASVLAYRAALLGTVALQKRYMASMGPYIGGVAKFFQSLAVWFPRSFRRIWVMMGKFFADFGFYLRQVPKLLKSAFLLPFKIIGRAIKLIFSLVVNLPAIIGATFKALRMVWVTLFASNPIGWIAAAIALAVVLYNKSKTFRDFIDSLFRFIKEGLKFVWNLTAALLTFAMIKIKQFSGWFKAKVWTPLTNFFSKMGTLIGKMWDKFKDSTVGKWLDKYIVQPIKAVVNWIMDAFKWLTKGLNSITRWLSNANDSLAEKIAKKAEENGVYKLPTFNGNDTPDIPTPITPSNPLVTQSTPTVTNNRNTDSSMNFSAGAIQIIVQKGDNIDESELARKVKEIVIDLSRTPNVRGGMV